MKFKQITVNCTTEVSEEISYLLHEYGSMGEVFEDYADVKRVLDEKLWDYADESLFKETEGCTVSGFFTLEADTALITEKLMLLRTSGYADFSALDVSVSVIDSTEWENEWKKYYKPFNIGKIVIVPEWIKYTPKPNDIPVILNPGLAFGTGTHETTSMCIDLLQRIDLHEKTVLDFGCGSGILGICATALGAKSVVFADTDEQAITATAYNCKLNGIPEPKLLCKDVREMTDPADVITANITADVLCGVLPVIKSSLKNGGYVIISGIISDKRNEVMSAYGAEFEPVDSIQKNEWSAFLYKL